MVPATTPDTYQHQAGRGLFYLLLIRPLKDLFISGIFLKHAIFSKICTHLKLCSARCIFASLKTSELSPFVEKSPEVKALMGYLQRGLRKDHQRSLNFCEKNVERPF